MNDACVYDGLLNREGGGGCLANNLLLSMLLQQQTKGNNVAKYIYKPARLSNHIPWYMLFNLDHSNQHTHTWPKDPFT